MIQIDVSYLIEILAIWQRLGKLFAVILLL